MHVYICEMMLKGLKEALTVLILIHVTHVKGVKSGVCGFYATTVYRVMLLMLLILKGSKVYYVYSVLLPLQEGRPVQPSILWFSSSPPVSPRMQLCYVSWTCQN